MVYMSYDGGWEGRAMPAALAGAAQLRAIFNSGIRENHVRHAGSVLYRVPMPSLCPSLCALVSPVPGWW